MLDALARLLGLSVLLVACHAAEAPRRLKDPRCRPYVATKGEPCRGDRYLWVWDETAVCSCETVPGD